MTSIEEKGSIQNPEQSEGSVRALMPMAEVFPYYLDTAMRNEDISFTQDTMPESKLQRKVYKIHNIIYP